MLPGETPRRVAVVVHPSRPLDRALETLAGWAAEHGVEVVQLPTKGNLRHVFPAAEADAGDVVLALGGDGTALAALRAAAAIGAPVMGVACGSVGALTAVSVDGLAEALDRLRAGEWTTRALPALAVEAEDAADWWALNDFVVVRRGSGQLVVEVVADGELFVRVAGDGLIVATQLGSSGYNMAAGGPLLSAHAPVFVCTPLAMHAGSAGPLVLPDSATLTIEVLPTYAGFDVELDGRRRSTEASSFRLTVTREKARLVTFARTEPGLRRLRERGLIADSPRVLAREHRADGEAPSV